MRVSIHGGIGLVCFPSPPTGYRRNHGGGKQWVSLGHCAWSRAVVRRTVQGMSLDPTALTIVIRGCTTWEVWILEYVAWRGKGRRGSVKMEECYNPGRWNQVQRRQKKPGLHKSDPDTWQERSCHVPGNCRWAFYILPPALRSPFLSNSHCFLMFWVFAFIFLFPFKSFNDKKNKWSLVQAQLFKWCGNANNTK